MCGWVVLVLLAQAVASPQVSERELPAAPKQPIAFSHRAHAAIGIKCLQCHAIRDPGLAAGIPREALCMSCHESVRTESVEIRRLAEHAREGRPVAWKRIYTIPAYVWFSHRAHHVDTRIDCDACHGPVAERDALAKERPTSMQSCMDCHAKRGASNDCAFCHNPN